MVLGRVNGLSPLLGPAGAPDAGRARPLSPRVFCFEPLASKALYPARAPAAVRRLGAPTYAPCPIGPPEAGDFVAARVSLRALPDGWYRCIAERLRAEILLRFEHGLALRRSNARSGRPALLRLARLHARSELLSFKRTWFKVNCRYGQRRHVPQRGVRADFLHGVTCNTRATAPACARGGAARGGRPSPRGDRAA